MHYVNSLWAAQVVYFDLSLVSVQTVHSACGPTCPHAAAFTSSRFARNMCSWRATCNALSRQCWRSTCAALCGVSWAVDSPTLQPQ